MSALTLAAVFSAEAPLQKIANIEESLIFSLVHAAPPLDVSR